MNELIQTYDPDSGKSCYRFSILNPEDKMKVIAKYNNNRPDFIIYEGRNDKYGIYCSLYVPDEDYPYEVVILEEDKELFRGNYREAINWTQR